MGMMWIIVHLAFKTTTKLLTYDECWEKSRFKKRWIIIQW
jgi:hypothetical protein